MEEHRSTNEVILAKLESQEILWVTKFDIITDYIVEQKKINEKVDGRVSIVELAQANQTGKIAMISIVIGAGITFVFNWLLGHIR